MSRAYVVLAVIALAGAGWMFRHAHLAPLDYPQIERTQRNPAGYWVVVCKVNRWFGNADCERIPVDDPQAVREMEQWLKDREKK
jgi:hypothetical protein